MSAANQQWPPAPFDIAEEFYRMYAAWWTGDTDELTSVYAWNRRDLYHTAKAKAQKTFNPKRQEEDQFFWGRSNDQGTRRRHMTTPASVAAGSARLLFAKPPRVLPGAGDAENKELANRMGDIFGPRAYGGELVEAAELASVFGGVFLRAWWDKDVCDHVIPSHVSPRNAIPQFRGTYLSAVTFWEVLPATDEGDSVIYRHLEKHEKGKVTHSLFAGSDSQLGKQVPLDTHDETAWLTAYVNELGEIETHLDRLDVVYVPNLRPSRYLMNFPGLQPLGRSDFEGIESEFDALDETYSSWLRDVEDGKSRVFIDESMLDDMGPGQGGAFDRDRNLFTPVSAGFGAATDGGPLIQDVKFDIRFNEHAQTIAEIKSHILEHVGLASNHLSDGPLAVGVTATEINSQNSVTEDTRSLKINFWQAALTDFVKIVMQLDAIHFDTGLALTDEPTIKFATQKTMSDMDISNVIQARRGSGTMSKQLGVEMANPDFTPDEVAEELERIRQDALADAQLAYGQGLSPDVPTDPTEGTGPNDDAADQFADAVGLDNSNQLEDELPEYAQPDKADDPETAGEQLDDWEV